MPDSDFFAWEQLTAQLPRGETQPSPGDGIATRLWRRMVSRVGGERWLASVLRLHTLPPAQPGAVPVLAATLAPVSVFGADVVRRIARIEGIDSAGPLDDCCCRQFALIAPPEVAGVGDAMRHESLRNTMPAGGMHHDAAFPMIRFHTSTSE